MSLDVNQLNFDRANFQSVLQQVNCTTAVLDYCNAVGLLFVRRANRMLRWQTVTAVLLISMGVATTEKLEHVALNSSS